MSCDPITGGETTWQEIYVSRPVLPLTISKSEEIQVQLEDLERQEKDRPEGDLNEKRSGLQGELRKAQADEERAREEEIKRPTVIADPKERAKQQTRIIEGLKRLQAGQKANEPKKNVEAPKQPSSGPSLLPVPAAPAPSFLQGPMWAQGPTKADEAAIIVRNNTKWAHDLEGMGNNLIRRRDSNDRPTDKDLKPFFNEVMNWFQVVKFNMNYYSSVPNALNQLGTLLQEFGPKLEQLRSRLGGD
jgi:hypothetical protein